MQHDLFASATDWVVELMPGVQFWCTCPFCQEMPHQELPFLALVAQGGHGRLADERALGHALLRQE
eukprot:6289457-Lingulodinium_polyedra.AAC.1